MMRQPALGAAVSLQSLLGESNEKRQQISYDVKDEDRITVLASSKRNGLPTSTEMKKMLVDVRKNRVELLVKASDPRTNLHACLGSVIDSQLSSMHRIEHMTKKEASSVVVSLFEMMTVIHGRAVGEQAMTRNRKLSPLQAVVVSFTSLLEKVDAEIHRMINDVEGDTLLKGLPLGPQAKSMRFDPALVPEDRAHQCCPFCGLYSLNLCPENEGMEERNEAKLERYRAKMEIWDRYQQMKKAAETAGDPAPPEPNYRGDKMTRKPRKPGTKDLESPLVQCMCSTARCLREGTDIGSLCFVRCRMQDDDDNRHPFECCEEDLPRYPWRVSERSRRQCTCPYCTCRCNKRFRIADFQAIALRLITRSKLAEDTKTGEQVTASFVNTVMTTAMSSTATALKGAARDKDLPVDPSDVFATNVGAAAVRLSHALPVNAVQTMQRGMGRDTVVTLPSGDRFDTRVISSTTGKHGSNNRLPGQAGVDDVHDVAPGMVDRLNPKFDTVTPEFAEAAKNGPSPTALLFKSFIERTKAHIDLTTEASSGDDAVAVVSTKPAAKQNPKHPQHPKLPKGWPFEKEQKAGGDKIFDKIFMENMKKMHAKKKKREMSDKERRERRAAKKTAKLIAECKSKADETGREVAAGFGVTASQVTAFADGKVADGDGDYVNAADLLRGFKRMKASQESDKETKETEA